MRRLIDAGVLLRLFDALDPNYRQVFDALRLIRRLGHQPVMPVGG